MITKTSYIREEGGKYVVYSETGRRFGSYDTEEQAKKRLVQMEMWKHIKKESCEMRDKLIEKVATSLGVMERVINSRLSKMKPKHVNFEKVELDGAKMFMDLAKDVSSNKKLDRSFAERSASQIKNAIREKILKARHDRNVLDPKMNATRDNLMALLKNTK